MAQGKSRRLEILRGVLPYINTGNYFEWNGCLVFGASSFEELMEHLFSSPTTPDDRDFWDAVSNSLSDFKEHLGKQQAAERVSLDQAQGFRSAALDGLSQDYRERLRKIAEQALPQVSAAAKLSKAVLGGTNEDHLDAAFVSELLEKVPAVVSRTISLDQLNLDQVPDEVVRRYFGEAHLCYLFGFNVACVVLCRAVLASAIGKRFPPKHIPNKDKPPRSPGFKKLIKDASKGGLFKNVPKEWVDDVRDAGDNAIHNLPEFEQRWEGKLDEVLLYTRKVLEDLYTSN